MVDVSWTKGYSIFAQDLPFTTRQPFEFPGLSDPWTYQPTLTVSYGNNNHWLCQEFSTGFANPDDGNCRCRFIASGAMATGCHM